ncbi:MAG: hypothetical protein ACFFKA_01230 [Candidatus Thorarchaeota archaeon]
MQFYSQIGQDRWVCETSGYKKKGTWVDIGCGDPYYINNTYVLEKKLEWSGISIDSDPNLSLKWINSDRNFKNFICKDAMAINYLALFESNRLPLIIDYLSLDLEPPMTTFKVLTLLPFHLYKFRYITFETDVYHNKEVEPLSRLFFENLNYTFVKNVNQQDDFWVLK